MSRQLVSRAALVALMLVLSGCISSGAVPVTSEAEAPVVVAENAVEATGAAVNAPAPGAVDQDVTPCKDLVMIRQRGPSAAVGVAKELPWDNAAPRPLLAFDCGTDGDTTL